MVETKIISFLSAPGGVGKTSIAILLGWHLKESGRSNLLVDMDPSLGLTLTLKDIQEYYSDIEKKERTSADLLKVANRGEISQKDYKDYISRSRFKAVNLDFIASSIRLEDVMGEIWYGSTLGRSKKLKEALQIIPSNVYKYIFIDVIPCYGLKYALLNLIASEICLVPLRATPNDLGRTILMMRELEKKASSELGKREFQKKLVFVFNIIRFWDEKKVSKYGDILLSKFPDAEYFKGFISQTISFSRINTNIEKSEDENKVRNAFKSFYNDFERYIK